MTRPFYRSPVLWFGLPGLMFFFVAWIDSMSHVSHLLATAAGRPVRLYSSGADIGADWRSEPGIGSAPTTWALKDPHREKNPWPRKEWFPLPAYFAQHSTGATIHHYLTIPYWLIILTYLGLWQLPWLFRYHRTKRITAMGHNFETHAPAGRQHPRARGK